MGVIMRTTYDGDPQGLFDDVVKHLRQQQKRCLSDEGKCRYRANGLKCAVGGVMPDELYCAKYDIQDFHVGMLYEEADIVRFFGQDNQRLLNELQTVHDRNDVDNWENELKTVAQTYGLKYEILN